MFELMKALIMLFMMFAATVLFWAIIIFSFRTWQKKAGKNWGPKGEEFVISESEKVIKTKYDNRIYVKHDNKKRYPPKEVTDRITRIGVSAAPPSYEDIIPRMESDFAEKKRNTIIIGCMISALFFTFSFIIPMQTDEYFFTQQVIGAASFFTVSLISLVITFALSGFTGKKLAMLKSGEYRAYWLDVTQKMWETIQGRITTDYRMPRYYRKHYYYARCGDIVLKLTRREYMAVRDKILVFVFPFKKGGSIDVIVK